MTCRGCGRAIEWVKTAGGKSMPVDPARLTVVTDAGQTVTGRVSHFATCPKADSFRQARAGGGEHGERGAPR